MNLQKKRKKKSIKKSYWSYDLQNYVKQVFLIPKGFREAALGEVFLQRQIKKFSHLLWFVFMFFFLKRGGEGEGCCIKVAKERAQMCFLLILPEHHLQRKSITSQNRPKDQSKSS